MSSTLSRPVEAGGRPVVPGTPGWSIDDFADPAIRWPQDGPRYEIADGVLTMVAPPGHQGTDPVMQLRDELREQVLRRRESYRFLPDTDLHLRPRRVPRPDLMVLTADQWKRQHEILAGKGISGFVRYRPIYVMPELVLEFISEGYADHDRITKRGWYAEAGIAHYWLLDPVDLSLECLALDGSDYRTESRGVRPETVASAALGGVTIPLTRVWEIPDLT